MMNVLDASGMQSLLDMIGFGKGGSGWFFWVLIKLVRGAWHVNIRI